MENNPKKSKAFLITFILILILLVAGYYLFKNRNQIFDTKDSNFVKRIFSPLADTPKDKDLKVIEDPNTKITTTPVVPKKTGVVVTDTNGNKLVVAEAGEALKKGDVLYIAGFNKTDQPIVKKAIANDKNKSLVFGVAGEDMNKGVLGSVIIEGILNGVPTNKKEKTLWAVKNTLYLSDKVYGGMTKNPPISPSYVVPVGSVLKVDPKNGSIKIGGLNDIQTAELDKLNMTFFSNSSMEFVDATMGDLRDYWSSIFGNIDFTDIVTIDPNAPPMNPITLPNGETIPSTGGTIPGAGTDTTNADGTCKNGATNPLACTTKNGECVDKTMTNPPLCNIKIAEPNKCLLIEQNPLTFTPEEKARLAVLLRKFYLVSSTLKTSDDITTIYNEIDQQKNFIEQIKGLTNQCYVQINDGVINSNGWVRHGNPWYTKTSGGTFPYTNENRGYLNGGTQEQIDTERLLNIW